MIVQYVDKLIIKKKLSYVDGKEACETMQVVLVTSERQHFRQHVLLAPLDTEALDQLLQIRDGRLSNGEHCPHRESTCEIVEKNV